MRRRTAACALEHDLIVQTEAEFWHSRQIAFHLDGAQDLGPDDIASGVHLYTGNVNIAERKHNWTNLPAYSRSR